MRKNIDLHLLEGFEALMRERNVSRAAERMGLSQSAMSDVLARLRKHFDNPLLVRGRGGMQPTPLARELLPTVHDLVARLQALATMSDTFDPATCGMRFKVATSDYTQFLLMPTLAKIMAQQAPSASIDVLPVHILRVEEALDFGEIDIAVAYFPDPPQGLKRRSLFHERYVGIAAKGHPALAPGLTTKALAAFRHVSVAPSGLNFFRQAVDSKLAEHGLSRRVVVTSPHFALAAYLVAFSDLVLALPSRAAERLATVLPLGVFPLPFSLPEFEVAMYWHERSHGSAAHRWFREQVRMALRPDRHELPATARR